MTPEREPVRYRVVAVIWLDCGLSTYRLLQSFAEIEIAGVLSKAPDVASKIAGYLDIGAEIAPDLHTYYRNVDDINAVIDRIAVTPGQIDLVLAIGVSDILKGSVLSVPRLGCLGAHAAPLPERPGAAPIVWAILDGLSESAMTIFRMTEKIDNGLIYGEEPVAIDENEAGGSLRKKMDDALIVLLRRCLPDILSGTNVGTLPTGQRHYTRRRGPRDGEFSDDESADQILRKIRALSSPYPGAHFFAGDGVPIVVEAARKGDESLSYPRSSRRFGSGFKRRVLCVGAHPDDEALGAWPEH